MYNPRHGEAMGEYRTLSVDNSINVAHALLHFTFDKGRQKRKREPSILFTELYASDEAPFKRVFSSLHPISIFEIVVVSFI